MPSGEELRVLFVGRPEERKGLPILLDRLRRPGRARPLPAHRDRRRARGHPPLPRRPRADALDRRRWAGLRGGSLALELHEADVLCAPSLSGESFGMVLTEAFAAGTPVIASAIAGYSDVVTDGVDGRPRSPRRSPAPGRGAAARPPRARSPARRWVRRRGAAPSATPGRGWPIGSPRSMSGRSRFPSRRAAERSVCPLGGTPPRRRPAPPAAQRLPSLDPAPTQARQPRRRLARRVGLGVAGALGIGLTALAAEKIGIDNVLESIVRSNLTWS